MKAVALRLVAVGLLVGLPPILSAERASACTVEHRPVHDKVEESEAVFAGKPVRWEELEWSGTLFLVEFRVTRVWKGPRYETRWVGDTRTDCGNAFKYGVEYLIYGAHVSHPDRNSQYRASQVLLMTLDFASALEHAQEDLDYLGPGQPPVPGWVGPKPGEEAAPQPGDTGTGTWQASQDGEGWWAALAVGAVVLLACLGQTALRRRR